MIRGKLRHLLLALMGMFLVLGTTGRLSAATIQDPASLRFESAIVWDGALPLGFGLSTLSSDAAAARPFKNPWQELPSGARQITFSIAPSGGPAISFVKGTKVVSSSVPVKLQQQALNQAKSLISIRVPGRPALITLQMGQTGALYFSVHFTVPDPKVGRRTLQVDEGGFDLTYATPAAVPLPAPSGLLFCAVGFLVATGRGGARKRRR